MRKSTHSPEYLALRRLLVELRERAGLTQRQLAELLDREHSFVWRIEAGERRLDVVEFFWLCRVLEVDPPRAYRELVQRMDAQPAAATSGKALPSHGRKRNVRPVAS